MRTPEGNIKSKIRTFLLSKGHYVFSPVQMGMGARTLDLLACIEGRFCAIEVKAPGKKPSAFQRRIIDDIRADNGIALWFDDYDQFTAWYGNMTISGWDVGMAA